MPVLYYIYKRIRYRSRSYTS